jgi:predicted phage terminase large subunit-like protein
MNRDVQRIISDELFSYLYPETKLPGFREGLRTSEIFEIAGKNGVYRSAGVGGGITGMGGDIILIDDPFKDRAAADSPTIRQTIWDWYTSTLYTRLSPGGGLIVINTRWHHDDLSGRLLAEAGAGQGDKWRVVNFPAIAEQDEEFRKRGEALHPERYPISQLQKIRTAIGTRDWEALYQQHPTPESGTIFKEHWIRYWLPKDLPRFKQIVLSWDMAFKDEASSDFVVGQVWGKHGADLYLLDQVRGRLSFTNTVREFKAQAKKWPDAGRKLVEDKANGPAVIDTLKHEISGIIPVEPDGSKTARAHAVTALFEAGNVYIPSPEVCPWVREYVAELTQFPSVAHDDQVDATTQALRHFDKRHGMNISSEVRQRVLIDRLRMR